MAKKLYTVGAKVNCIQTYIYTTIAESEEEAIENIEDLDYDTCELGEVEDDSAPYDCEVIDEEEIDDDTE